MEAHKNDDQMQNCKRLTLFDLRREKRPGNAYDVSVVLELANRDVRSSTILVRTANTVGVHTSSHSPHKSPSNPHTESLGNFVQQTMRCSGRRCALEQCYYLTEPHLEFNFPNTNLGDNKIKQK